MMRRPLSCFGTAVLSAALLAGPAWAEPLKVQVYSDFESLDPTHVVSYVIDSALYDRLFALSADHKIVPGLAESWTVTQDTVVAKLKPNATCADGTKLTAEIVANSLTRMGAAETKAAYAYRTIGTAGYTVTHDDAAGTVTVKTNAPFSDLLLGLAMPWSGIVCPKGLSDPANLAGHAQGSGPYVIDEGRSLRGDHYMLVARKGYDWGPGGMKTSDPGVPQEMLVRVISNNTTIANELSTGGLDIGLVTGLDEQRLRRDPKLEVLHAPTYGMQMLLMQHGAWSPLSDPIMRLAFATAIDRELVNKAATQGTGVVATSYLSKITPCYSSATEKMYPKASAEAAKQLLIQHGWKPGNDGILVKDGKPLHIRLYGVSSLSGSAPEYIMEALQEMGASVTLRNLTAQEQNSVLISKDWDAELWAFSPPMPSPNVVAALVVPGAGNNYSNVNNEEFLREQKAALATSPDDPNRCEHWQTAQESLLRQFDILPLFAPVYSLYHKPGISFTMYAPLSPDLESIRVKQ